MSDKSVSIPERAREIAERLDVCDCELNGMQHRKGCPIFDALTEMAHSERELCAQELEETASHTRNMIRKETLIYAAEKMRDGGQSG